MIWDAIGFNQLLEQVFFQGLGPGHGNGITAQCYVDQILRSHVVPFFNGHVNFILQQDNAHSARVTPDILQQQNIVTMVWPALSPDMNPIKHLWDLLQRELNSALPRPMTATQLQHTILQSWNNIPRASINHLIHIDANIGHTWY